MSLSLGKRMSWLWLFPLIGVAMLLGAMALHVHGQRFVASAARAEGIVVDHVLRHDSDDAEGMRGSPTYCPVVHFADGKGKQVEFVGSFCSRPRSNKVGEHVPVLYPQGQPDEARIDSFMSRSFGSLVMGGIGGVFLLIGAALVGPSLYSRRTARDLLTTGRPIQADVVEVARNTSIHVNGHSPWRIHAQWQDPATRKLHVFKSDSIWFDPEKFVGEHVTVLIEPTNPKRYWVDTRFLPEQA